MEKGTWRRDAKTWFLTYPRCDISKEEARDLLIAKGKPIKGGCVAQELHKDGTPHLHVYLQLEKQFSCKSWSFWDLNGKHGDYDKARNPAKALEYVRKDNNYIEWGDLDIEAMVNARQSHLAYTGKRMQEEPLHIIADDHPELMHNYKKLQQNVLAYKKDKLEAYTHETVRGIWIYGPPGVGKSHFVRATEPDLYIKAQNKWWDGYTGQTAVLLDDLDSDCLAHYLKIWADKYSFDGEVKGDTVRCTYQRFYVTSNFSIQEVFKNLPEVTIEAIRRRFDVRHYLDRTLGLVREEP